MAALGFNVLAMQEDLMTSLIENETNTSQAATDVAQARVLSMLSQFNVLSIQVVFALLDLCQEKSESAIKPA